MSLPTNRISTIHTSHRHYQILINLAQNLHDTADAISPYIELLASSSITAIARVTDFLAASDVDTPELVAFTTSAQRLYETAQQINASMSSITTSIQSVSEHTIDHIFNVIDLMGDPRTTHELNRVIEHLDLITNGPALTNIEHTYQDVVAQLNRNAQHIINTAPLISRSSRPSILTPNFHATTHYIRVSITPNIALFQRNIQNTIVQMHGVADLIKEVVLPMIPLSTPQPIALDKTHLR